jgi:predicted AlkP superfamily pyrophosphatase or phosphodiesterase
MAGGVAQPVFMRRLAVINIVGLTQRLIGPHTPCIERFARAGSIAAVRPAFPAVTCTAQSNYLTGVPPASHGIVGNGWYDRELAEVHFWKQSERLVQAPAFWERLRRQEPGFTCAKLFWWFNMGSTADYSITPRPMYPADGRKIFDIYTWPYSIRPEVKADLGEFPFLTFWGPAAGMDTRRGSADAASRWIAEAAKWIERRYRPTLSLIYLPHLDYALQRLGPDHANIGRDLGRIDAIVGDLIDTFTAQSVRVLLLSEYGIVPVSKPIHLNRLFRERGWLTIKEELGLELVDFGASRAFAVADHQVAHVYIRDRAIETAVRRSVEATDGVAAVLDEPARRSAGINHPRSGDLIAVARSGAWFTYYYWLDDRRAPDFARTVDIHRKPGYDPVELFLDRQRPWIEGRLMWRLLQKRLGFRGLMDVIPLDAMLVRGSHGASPADVLDYPLLMAGDHGLSCGSEIDSIQVCHTLSQALAAPDSNQVR